LLVTGTTLGDCIKAGTVNDTNVKVCTDAFAAAIRASPLCLRLGAICGSNGNNPFSSYCNNQLQGAGASQYMSHCMWENTGLNLAASVNKTLIYTGCVAGAVCALPVLDLKAGVSPTLSNSKCRTRGGLGTPCAQKPQQSALPEQDYCLPAFKCSADKSGENGTCASRAAGKAPGLPCSTNTDCEGFVQTQDVRFRCGANTAGVCGYFPNGADCSILGAFGGYGCFGPTHYCNLTECVPLIPAGSACPAGLNARAVCESPSICVTGRCSTPGVLGGACGTGQYGDTWCQDSMCDFSTRRCVAVPGEGDRCDTNGYDCGLGLVCGNNGTGNMPNVCTRPFSKADGDRCFTAMECMVGSACMRYGVNQYGQCATVSGESDCTAPNYNNTFPNADCSAQLAAATQCGMAAGCGFANASSTGKSAGRNILYIIGQGTPDNIASHFFDPSQTCWTGSCADELSCLAQCYDPNTVKKYNLCNDGRNAFPTCTLKFTTGTTGTTGDPTTTGSTTGSATTGSTTGATTGVVTTTGSTTGVVTTTGSTTGVVTTTGSTTGAVATGTTKNIDSPASQLVPAVAVVLAAFLVQ
jgi:hypothetical protein